MIKTQNKRLEITLTSDEIDLLNSLSLRFNISKSTVIKQALKVFASKRKHYLTISYKEVNSDETETALEKIQRNRTKTQFTEAEKKKLDEEWENLFNENHKNNK